MENRSPIYFVNLIGHIKAIKSKEVSIIHRKEIVVKGTIDQIKKSDSTKKSFLRDHFQNNKKVKDFDLNRLTITEVEIIKFLGYGVKLK